MSAHGRAGQEHYKFFPCSNEVREKSRAQKITEARRVGAPRNIASLAERGELTRIFEMRSNLLENVHKISAEFFLICDQLRNLERKPIGLSVLVGWIGFLVLKASLIRRR